ncbi:MAG: hypothetical protein UU34_C0010G0007 [Candidatus Curtissbacteria bacterium GW2011_GWA1_41_11]|uniref:General stress protein n=1 Tax=Candidatus Curtissbacteria bacterium GW2011_GWA1_41_11 TaxID=1618409 RepID=A0A0G0UCU6_9BACT|nr:MAG: hypothetical protein UU34_C0010G0007 [Candidatus Curtissbacteria bacterium GW2011_GWA1_41_11]
MSENHDKAPAGGSNFLVGAIIGAALTYLFATKSGQKIKNELIKDLSDVLESIGQDLEEKVPETKAELDSVKEKIATGLEGALARKEEVTEEIKEEIREVPQQIEKIQKKGRRFFFRKSRTES